MESIIDRAKSIVEKAASEYQAANEVYYIEMGTNEDRMQKHPSLENYCEKCIEDAVQEKRDNTF